ncbi:MAG: hypothetical protein HY287_10560 [Planctomycetes bacterium]|nr:hypothetical protein [Planctomycetota bacterium]
MSKMDQEKLSELLSAYHDDELEVNERSLVDKLLREDASARRLLAELRETSQLVSSLPRHAAPASIAADLQSRLERAALLGDATHVQSKPTPHRSRRWLGRLSLAAMLAFAAFGIYWFSRQSHSTRKEQVATTKGGTNVEANRKFVNVESAISANRHIESNKPVQLQPPLDLRLAEGVPSESVTNHTFDSEPVVWQIASATEKDRVAVANALTNSLRTQGIPDLRSNLPKAKEAHIAADSAFFVNGKAGVNFQSPEQQQILVHAQRSQVDAMFASLPKTDVATRDVQFRAGDMMARGVEPSRKMLPIVQSQLLQNAPSPQVATRTRTRHIASETERSSGSGVETSPSSAPLAKWQPAPEAMDAVASKKTESKGAYFGGLLKMFGLDSALLAPLEPKQATTDQSKQKSDQEPAPAAPIEPLSLVEKSLHRMEKDAVPRQDERPEVEMKDAKQDKPPAAAAPQADDPTITVVVQIGPSNTDQTSAPVLKSDKPPATPVGPASRTKSK